MKQCNKCLKTLDDSMFLPDPKHPEKKRNRCRPCCNEYLRGYNPEYRMRKYGLTLVQYKSMKAAQADRCAICGGGGKLVVDHDHDTGRVRALLCLNCNGGLGLFHDSSGVLALAIGYLQRFKK
jgi:hypothetical protein